MINLKSIVRVFLLVLLASTLSACDLGWKQIGATEFGIRFRKLPIFLGGGISDKVIRPGELALVMPWDSIYTFDAAIKDISWGPEASAGDPGASEYLYTRALDGNEVALAITVRYQLIPKPESLYNLLNNVATSDSEIRALVKSVARSDIRTYMNELETAEFLAKEPRYKAVDKVRDSMVEKLGPYGIDVTRVNLDHFRFERLLEDGSVDGAYQETLEEIQRIREDIGRERSRIDTVRAKKQQDFNDRQAKVNRVVEEAEGYKQQAVFRGNAYNQEKVNQAKGVLATGRAEVEGIQQKIQAFSGPGGEALVKLQLARELLKNDPKFVLMSRGQGTGELEVHRTDTNELINQVGLLESLPKQSKKDIKDADSKPQ